MHTLSDLRRLILRIAQDTSGAVSNEYSYLTAFIAVVSAAGMIYIGSNLQERFSFIGDTLASASTSLPTLW